MTKDMLPERLRNMEGLHLVDGEVRTLHISEKKMQALESLYITIFDNKPKGG